MLALLCEISRWFLTVILVGMSVWLTYLIHKTNTLQGHVRVAALAFVALSNMEKLSVLFFRDQFFLAREDQSDINMCYIYAQMCHGLFEPMRFYTAIVLARHSYPGAFPSKNGHIGGGIWMTVAFISICIPVDQELFTPPDVPGFCVVSMITGLVSFANTVILPLTLWNVANKIPANERQVHVRHFAWISLLVFVYGIFSFVDANLVPGDGAVIMRETMFLLSWYFTINVCYYWIIIPGMLLKAAPVFERVLLKKKRFVTQSIAPPIRMNSVSPRSKRKATRKVKRSGRRPGNKNYRTLLSPPEEKDDIPDVEHSPTRVTTKTSSQRISELNFDIATGTRRTPKAVLGKGLTFPRSASPKKSIETNLRSQTLTRSSVCDEFPETTANGFDSSDNERNEEDAAGDNEADEDFMLKREPTLFPSMPCSTRTSVVWEDNETEPLGDKELSTVSTSADGDKVELILQSTEKGEDVFGVGFGESPSTKRESNRDTVMWNINDIPIL